MRKLLGLGMLIVLVLIRTLVGQTLAVASSTTGSKFFVAAFPLVPTSTVDGDNYGGYHKAGWNTGEYSICKAAEKTNGQYGILYTKKEQGA